MHTQQAQASRELSETYFSQTSTATYSSLGFRATAAEVAQVEQDSEKVMELLRAGLHPAIRVVRIDQALDALSQESVGGVIVDNALDLESLTKITQLSLTPRLSQLGIDFHRCKDELPLQAVLGDRIIEVLGKCEHPRFEDREILAIAEHFTDICQLASQMGSVFEFPFVFRSSTAAMSTDMEAIAEAEMTIHVDDEPIVLETYGMSRTEIFLPQAVRCVGIQEYDLVDPRAEYNCRRAAL